MAKQRMVSTKFWSDSWVRRLSITDRYVFLYLITNEHTNLCGIYELPLSMMAFECGVDERDLISSILPRLCPKILYLDDWVCIPNFEKHHNQGSPQLKKGIDAAKTAVPSHIMHRFDEMGKGIDTLSPLTLTSTFTSTLTADAEGIPIQGRPIMEFTFLFEKLGVEGWRGMHLKKHNIDSSLRLLDQKSLIQWDEFMGRYSLYFKDQYCPKARNPSELEEKYDRICAYLDENESTNVIKL